MSLPLIALALTLTAEPPLELPMDNVIDSLRQDFAVRSGMAVVMVKGDKVIYRGNFGYADIAAQKAVTDDTRFYIASNTKPLFALAWLQAKGPQSLKSILAEPFPAIPFAPAIEADKVTVKALLTHSAGLSGDWLENAVAITGLHDQPRRRQMLSLLAVNPQAPRGQCQYTNLGYDILGEALSPDWQQPYQFSQGPSATPAASPPLAGDIVFTGSLAKGFNLCWGTALGRYRLWRARQYQGQIAPHPQVVRFEVDKGKVQRLVMDRLIFEHTATD